jgi:hydroxyethylthiazole kinase
MMNAAARDLAAIREKAHLVHNITNYVVMNTTANALLALGASPVMAHAEEEVKEMVGIAGALCLNIGTLSQPWIGAMKVAGKAARERGIPMVLDPVGAGATRLRTETAVGLLRDCAPAVVRGNASEIRALAEGSGSTKGVDSTESSEATLDAARALSQKYGCVVSMSGKTDLIVTGDRVARVHNGDPMMTRVTGLGCTASALTGACLAVNRDAFAAASHAMLIMGVAGEIARERAEGPGSLQLAFLDVLFTLSGAELEARGRLELG